MVPRSYPLETLVYRSSKVIYPITYLGPVSWYRCWLNDTDALIEQYETYQKQTIRNHCNIVGPNGVQTLTIPIERMHERKILTKDIHITYQEKWQQTHWQALKTAYRNSPFYDYYIDLFEPLYSQKYDYLLDFNIKLMEIILKLSETPKTIQLTDKYIGITQLQISNSEMQNPNYYQVFQEKHGFIADMSIIDLLFNMGPESYKILNTK